MRKLCVAQFCEKQVQDEKLLSSKRALSSSPSITITIPIAMNVKAKLLSTASMVRSNIGKRIRNGPKMNASFTMNCRASPTP